MKRLFAWFFRRRPALSRPGAASLFPNLPESIAYSAFLASGVEGVGELSFAQFTAALGGGRGGEGCLPAGTDFAS